MRFRAGYAAIALLTINTSAMAGAWDIIPGLGNAYDGYQIGDGIYRHELNRQGRPGDYAPIGSPEFLRRAFPQPSWDDYSRSTGGVFVKPRNCWGPYC